ncbi:MAG: (Fe-S)-binding protein [Bacteroidales bacterium]|nr:(Fe-S)-binding protein [Bacteroidales bacterium]
MTLEKEVDIFIPCCVDRLAPQTAFNLLKIFQKLNVKINYNYNQTCCGQTAFKNGFWDEAKEIGEKFIRDFSNKRYVVAPSARCVSYVKNYYSKLFYNTGLHLENNELHDNIFELTDFLVNMMRVTDIGATFNHTVTFHDCCNALREYGIKEEPRILLRHVKGLELIEMNKTEECCGFGGMFAMKFEPISVAMTQEKINHALATGAEYIVSTDMTCLANMDTYIKKHELPIKTIHIVDVLASGLK